MHSPHRKSFVFIRKALHHFFLFFYSNKAVYFHFSAHENVKFCMTQTQRQEEKRGKRTYVDMKSEIKYLIPHQLAELQLPN